MNKRSETVRQALSMVDLTRLEDDDLDSPVEALCRRAQTPFGSVAAVCIYPRFIRTARRILSHTEAAGRIGVATVVNFPEGEEPVDCILRAIREALSSGADEIDLVFPWRALQAGDAETGRSLLLQAREACGEHTLKVILETGALCDPDLIRQAAGIAINAGADFLKTSTGKVPVNATPEAARILLETIRDSGADVGCKVSGGIRTTGQAIEYLDLAAKIMGSDWIGPNHFRFGASGLLDALLTTLNDGDRAVSELDSY